MCNPNAWLSKVVFELRGATCYVDELAILSAKPSKLFCVERFDSVALWLAVPRCVNHDLPVIDAFAIDVYDRDIASKCHVWMLLQVFKPSVRPLLFRIVHYDLTRVA